MAYLAAKALWAILIILFIVVFIFTGIVHNRQMRKLLEKGSIFSPTAPIRALGLRDTYLFIVLVLCLMLIVMAMGILKQLGL